MALVDYASSSSGGGDEDNIGTETLPSALGNLKRKRGQDKSSASELPPLPSKFHDLYASTTRISTRDDPALHGGRKRVTPHVEGNWPTHLYIEWYPATTEHELLTSLITRIKDGTASRDGGTKVESLLTSDLGAPLPLHISLSRSIGFTTEQKDSFVTSMQESIACCGIRPFKVSFEGLAWVPNFEKTTWFLVLHLQRPDGDGLNRLLGVCNEAVEEYSQPPLYASAGIGGHSFPKEKGNERPSKTGYSGSDHASKKRKVQDSSSAFHISIGWALEQPSNDAVDLTMEIRKDEIFENVKRTSFEVEAVKVKVGNVVTSIPLPLKAVEGKGLFGS